jgi:hypothetical protein
VDKNVGYEESDHHHLLDGDLYKQMYPRD